MKKVSNEVTILEKISESLRAQIGNAYSWLDSPTGKIIGKATASLASFGIGDPTGMIVPLILESSDRVVRTRFVKHFPDLVERLNKNQTQINYKFLASDSGQQLLKNTLREIIRQTDEEKIEYYKKLLIQSYTEPNPDQELIESYKDILDTLQTSDILILKTLHSPDKVIKEIMEKNIGNSGSSTRISLKLDVQKFLNINSKLFDKLILKLENNHLISTSGYSVNWAQGDYPYDSALAVILCRVLYGDY